MRIEDFYYIDKTGLIRELLENEAYVNLFTRPRRFGKTLNMSGNMDNWIVQSNAESGNGYSDINIEIRWKGIGIVIELKYAEYGALEKACKEAMEQINKRNYEEALINDGMTIIYKYGIACYKKRCKVISG